MEKPGPWEAKAGAEDSSSVTVLGNTRLSPCVLDLALAHVCTQWGCSAPFKVG